MKRMDFWLSDRKHGYWRLPNILNGGLKDNLLVEKGVEMNRHRFDRQYQG